MNNDNAISNATKLFGYIGEHAGVSRFSAILNKTFKANSDDMMMIPMNIREDDFYFTLSNMKKSHVNGAVISNEYVTLPLDLLDTKSGLVERTGMCDIVFKNDEKLHGDIFSIRVLLEKLKDHNATKVAIIGINHYAKAFSLMGCGFQVSYFYDNLEELMAFCDEMELANPDINRIADGMDVDLSTYDVVLDFSDFQAFDMVTKLAPLNIDMKNAKEYSALKTRASQVESKYVGYDDLLDDLTAQVYRVITKG
jgi:hypothetical protein